MSVPIQEDSSADIHNHLPSLVRRPLWTLFTSWEVYLILLVAAFLRLFRIGTTEFDSDQSDIFTIARNVVSHGHLVLTSNIASIHIYNPPAVIYLLMIPAALSSNPVWGAVFIALLAIASVLLTYVFTRRYYGRLAGTLAALLYATAPVAVFYSRFMWNQNLLLFFVPLLIWFLFRGVVTRRPNWLFPSVILVALLVQFHASSIVLAASLLIALLLAPRRTIRWYDFILSIVGVFVLYSPYILWLVQTNFQDVHTLLNASHGLSVIDTQALFFYLQLLGPFSAPITNKLSLLYPYWTIFGGLEPFMTILLFGGVVWAAKSFLLSHSGVRKNHRIQTLVSSCWRWWQDLRASPMRSGICILLSWQIISLLYLTHHNIVLFQHYFIVFMPGPFILIGIFLSKLFEWIPWRTVWQSICRWGLVGICILLITTEGIASLGYVIDASTGHYVDQTWSGNYYSSLNSLQHAMEQAEQLAQKHHLNHIYISSDPATRSSLRYLAGGAQTPTTVIDNGCLIVPGVDYGSAVLLLAPRSNQLAVAMNVDHATLIGTIPHPGGPPFTLLILHPLPTAKFGGDNYAQSLQFVAANAFDNDHKEQIATRWTLEDSAQASYLTSYNYMFTRRPSGISTSLSQYRCSSDSIRAGDQLIANLGVASQEKSKLQASMSTTLATTLSYNLMGVFHIQFDTFQLYDTPTKLLKTKAGAVAITITGT